MSVVAIKCVACEGSGAFFGYSSRNERCWSYQTCPLCDGTGTERPPQDDDKRAQQAIEGTRHEDL